MSISKLLAPLLIVGLQVQTLAAPVQSMNLNISSICYSDSKDSLELEYYSPYILDESSLRSEIQKSKDDNDIYVLAVTTDQLAGLALPVSGILELPVTEYQDFF